jgi:hypothetical protein
MISANKKCAPPDGGPLAQKMQRVSSRERGERSDSWLSRGSHPPEQPFDWLREKHTGAASRFIDLRQIKAFDSASSP